MSILIKGMKMPTSCDVCPMMAEADDYCVCFANNKFIPWRWASESGVDQVHDKPDWCPLVPVPEHGDLIDRKTAYDSLLNGMVMTGYQSRALDCICEFYVPTVIPADPADKEG